MARSRRAVVEVRTSAAHRVRVRDTQPRRGAIRAVNETRKAGGFGSWRTR